MNNRALFKDSFRYPFRENGRMILIWGTILSGIPALTAWIPMIGPIVSLLIGAYLCAVFFEVMVTTATGSDDCSGFPDLSDILEDLIMPFIKIVAALLVSFLPYLILLFSLSDSALFQPLSYLLIVFGIAYFPMAILAVGILHTFTALSPHIVVPAIKDAGGFYWVIVGILILVFVLESVVEAIFGDFFFLGVVTSAFIGMLALMINGRLIGLLYRNREEELGWV